MKQMATPFRQLSKLLLQSLFVTLSITLLASGICAGALHDAAADGDVERVQQLIAAGEDVNTVDEDGDTPLHNATLRGHLAVVQTLCDAGVNVNIKDGMVGATALHWAVGRGYLEVVKTLLAAQANLEARDLLGETPLFWAAERGYLALVKVLCHAGAATSQIIINLALVNRHYEVARFLIETGDVRVATFHERLKAFPLAKQKKLCNDLLKITAEYVNCNWPRSPQ